ncbi:MAG TPA: hypothetical protein VFD22_11980, partial [Gemmatimonadaceae bacterium]|nr:hypothetical protein [Gemmatimonadaceae bacterium]
MRYPTQLLVIPFAMALAAPAFLAAQETGNTPVSVRWNRLVPALVDQSATRRRATRAYALAAGDSAAARRIAQTPEPFIFTIHTLLAVAQYNAISSAKNTSGASAGVAAASASAAVLTEMFRDSAVRASIAQELARD